MTPKERQERIKRALEREKQEAETRRRSPAQDDPLERFLQTWGPNCGAPRSVFEGQLRATLEQMEEYTPAARAAGVDVSTHLELKARVTKRAVKAGLSGKDKQGRVTLEITNGSNVSGELVLNFLNQETIRSLPTREDFRITIGLPAPK